MKKRKHPFVKVGPRPHPKVILHELNSEEKNCKDYASLLLTNRKLTEQHSNGNSQQDTPVQ